MAKRDEDDHQQQHEADIQPPGRRERVIWPPFGGGIGVVLVGDPEFEPGTPITMEPWRGWRAECCS